jgi:hypothetical protein
MMITLLTQTLVFSDEASLQPEYQKWVKSFVAAISTNDWKAVSKLVKYLLRRQYPIPDVRNENELLQRFGQIFDQDLRAEIVHSSIAKDWGAVGWRGIMLDSGSLWLDYDGKVIAVNHQSEVEKNLKNELIEKDKKGLHPLLREFEQPVLICESDKFLIRIDCLKDYEYRYATWPKGSQQSSKPDLVLKNGKIVSDGSGGNHYFDFKNGDYLYRVYVEVMGSYEDPPASLEIYKSGKLISTQIVTKIQPEP